MENIEREAHRSLARLLPHLEHEFSEHLHTPAWETFRNRLARHFPQLFANLLGLYGTRYDFFYHLEQTLILAARNWLARPDSLRALDARRETDPAWAQSGEMVGGVCYVDLFAGDLDGIRARIPYFQELGLTYLHLMPLFAVPEGRSDGGYAISDYRRVHDPLGSMDDLRTLAEALRAAGISLVLDFVFNHTADDHAWAQRARAGDAEHADFYFLFPDRTLPDAYDRTLREIFPDQHSGSFTYHTDFYHSDIYHNEISGGQGRWVWTTFNSFQWDLNYKNPAVFQAMANEMLFLANVGVEILRLDALAFTWKEMGTDCENLPQAHMLVQAFNAMARIAAPALLFKSEAIVHPDEVEKYIGQHECQLSYNPLLMALLWESLATRNVRLLRHSMMRRFAIAPGCAWVNYVRVHDDIGWTFDDGDAAALAINGYDHRRFLNAFYTGRFPGSFARGVPFQENPRTGDARISGTLASLAGLEGAQQTGDHGEIELAVRRILLLHGIILSIGGIPLIYLGDEIGQQNDYDYRCDPTKADDSRWIHRLQTDWTVMERRSDPQTVEGRIYGGVRHLIDLRKSTPALSDQNTQFIDMGNDHIFAYLRSHGGESVLVLVNFSEHPQAVAGNEVRLYGMSYHFRDLISGRTLHIDESLTLEPYEMLWLAPR